MIRAENLVKSFYKTQKKGKKIEFNAVDDISLYANPGEIVGILGPNGAGKTTLLRMLASLMKPTSGRIVVEKDGQEITDSIDIKGNIGYLSGNTKMYDRLSVRELLEMFAGIYGVPDNEIEERVNKTCEVLQMEDFIDNRIEKLSTGQTQRASIARCIVHSPDIYIFDEPTLGLDIISSSAIVRFMKKEKEAGKTILYSTHYMEEADYLCDRVIMINGGKVVCDETPNELKARTNTDNMRDAFGKIINLEELEYEN